MTIESDADRAATAAASVAPALWAIAAVGAVLVAGCSLLDFTALPSVATGVVLALANLWIIARLVRAFFAPRSAAAPWGLVALMKLGALFGGLYALAHFELIELIPLIIGYAAMPVGIVLAQLKPANEEAQDARTQ